MPAILNVVKFKWLQCASLTPVGIFMMQGECEVISLVNKLGTCTVKFWLDAVGIQVATCMNSLPNAEVTFVKTTVICDAKAQ